MKSRRNDAEPYITKDGSEIRELLHPDHHNVNNQSLAEAVIPAGATTHLHLHRNTEEIYHITAGEGILTLGDEQVSVSRGDSVSIAPGTAHCIENCGTGELVILCCCSPAYSHEDTELLDIPSLSRS
ncbi:MAG: cupin domain-containing protein [Candidatus Sedimenticola sp. 20ELBAFRAG]